MPEFKSMAARFVVHLVYRLRISTYTLSSDYPAFLCGDLNNSRLFSFLEPR